MTRQMVKEAKTRFTKLLEPGQIGNIKIKNRMFKTAANSTLGDNKSSVSERVKAFYTAIARGGIGFIVVESSVFESPSEEILPPGAGDFLKLADNQILKSVRELTSTYRKRCG